MCVCACVGGVCECVCACVLYTIASCKDLMIAGSLLVPLSQASPTMPYILLVANMLCMLSACVWAVYQ